MASASTPAANTVGFIAARTGYPVHRVEYLIKARGITPRCRAGKLRLFSEADVERIRSELRRMDEEREQNSK